ncbi:MAG: PhoH family protein [Candidatus Krumholzibacteria bacterium]|nr:PhoH family protein [Candidatus Krumholzibacteria bacterium]
MAKRDFKRRVVSIAGIDPIKLLGVEDRNLRLIEEHFDERVAVRGDEIILSGSPRRIEQLTRIFERLIELAGSGRSVTEGDVLTVIRGGTVGFEKIGTLEESAVFYSSVKRRNVVPRSVRQQEYVDAIRRHDVVFAIGPAGTGKTYLAIACALAALKNGDIERIFISRPVVEAGENLGFLPGDMQEKIEPYLRPIFDAFRDMIGQERVLKMIASGVLEIAPLAYMRGRTLNGSFAILDEAQNSTIGQMKMFLTRLGESSKAIVTGDITQIDLADPAISGLVAVREILDGVEGIAFITFGEEDVVRHRLVKRIIRAFSTKGAALAARGPGDHAGSARAHARREDAEPPPEKKDD